MKKIVIIVSVINLALAGSLMSQNRMNLFGIQSGINYNMNYTDKSINSNHIFKTGWTIGLNYEKYVSDNWSLNIELNRTENKSIINNYSTFGFNSQVGITATSLGSVIFHEKNNQLLLSFKRYLAKSKNIFFEFGWDIKFINDNIGSWNYQLTTIYDQSNIFEPILLNEPEISSVNSRYLRSGGYIGINLGLGYKYKVTNKIQVSCKGRFSNQLKKTAEHGGIILRYIEALIGVHYTM